VNGKKYSQKDYKIQGTYVIGNKLNTVYDLNNPENHKVDYYSFKIVGWIVVAIGISIIVGAWIWFIIARTFKVAAAATGVGTIVDFADGNNN
jgi:hypothetical protein